MAAQNTRPAGSIRPGTIRVMVVEDHPDLRHSLRRRLEQGPRYRVCAEAEGADGAIRALRVSRPDLVVLDLALSGEDGLRVLSVLHRAQPALPILALSMVADEILAAPVLAAGARGYLSKADASECLVEALDVLEAGGVYRRRKAQDP